MAFHKGPFFRCKLLTQYPMINKYVLATRIVHWPLKFSSRVFPKTFTTSSNRSTSVTVQDPREFVRAGRPCPVSSICSLLCNSVQNVSDFDCMLKDYKEVLNSDLVLQVLMNYRQLGRIKTLEFFSWAGTQMGFQFEDSVIEYMVGFLGKRKLFDDMKCLLVTLKEYNGRVSCRAFSIGIRFLGMQGRFREALCLFQEMETTFRCKPDNYVYNDMLYVLCKRETSGELIDVALSIFQKMESPDTYSYSNILVGLCKFGRFDDAIRVCREMGQAGLVPTRSAANVLISKFCLLSSKDGAINRVRIKDSRKPFTILVPNVGSNSEAIVPAIGIFWAVHDAGILPNAFIMIELITELCRLGKMEEAIKVLKVVEERRLTCVEEAYSLVIQALCIHRLVDEVSDLFGRMILHDMKPTLAVYNSIICMLCKLGRLNDAERVFELMNKKRCLPDNIVYTALIHGYVAARRSEDAYQLLTEMLSLGCIPHFHTYTMVYKLLRGHERMDLSVKLERKLESQMLYKHCREGELEIAYDKLRSMLEKGFSPPMYVRDAFEEAFQKYGKVKIAQELLQMMDKANKSEGKETSCY